MTQMLYLSELINLGFFETANPPHPLATILL